jgi:hypothetical protein
MTLNLTDAQSQAVKRGEAVRVNSNDLGEVVVLPAATYQLLSEEQDIAASKQLSGKALVRWGRENPYEA